MTGHRHSAGLVLFSMAAAGWLFWPPAFRAWPVKKSERQLFQQTVSRPRLPAPVRGIANETFWFDFVIEVTSPLLKHPSQAAIMNVVKEQHIEEVLFDELMWSEVSTALSGCPACLKRTDFFSERPHDGIWARLSEKLTALH